MDNVFDLPFMYCIYENLINVKKSNNPFMYDLNYIFSILPAPILFYPLAHFIITFCLNAKVKANAVSL